MSSPPSSETRRTCALPQEQTPHDPVDSRQRRRQAQDSLRFDQGNAQEQDIPKAHSAVGTLILGRRGEHAGKAQRLVINKPKY